MSALPKGGLQHALPTTDIDPVETREWLEPLEAVIRDCGPERGLFLLGQLKERARDRGIKPSVAQAEWTVPFLSASEAVQEAKRLSALRHSAAVSGASHYRLANSGRGLRASPP